MVDVFPFTEALIKVNKGFTATDINGDGKISRSE